MKLSYHILKTPEATGQHYPLRQITCLAEMVNGPARTKQCGSKMRTYISSDADAAGTHQVNGFFIIV